MGIPVSIYRKLRLSPSPRGVPYGESLRGAFLVEVLVVSGDPRKSIYKVTVMCKSIQPLDVADGSES